MANDFLFTSESVSEGHPDKVADQISDAILDAIIRDDPDARVACETATTTGLVLVLGEITTSTYIELFAFPIVKLTPNGFRIRFRRGQFARGADLRANLSPDAVSYTHLTLPTTPYV